MSDQLSNLCLICKILANNRTLGKTGVISILKGAWRTKEPFTVHPWDHNHFLFEFKNIYDVEKIIADSPWSVMGFYLALAPWNPDQTLTEIDFNRGMFWVQAHGLPFDEMTKAYAKELASKIGNLIEVDCVGDGGQLSRPFLRFRVSVDLRAPLCPGLKITHDGLTPIYVSFKYERLSNFCYACGRLGHDDDTCTFPRNPAYSKKSGDEMREISTKRISLTTKSNPTTESGATSRKKMGGNSTIVRDQVSTYITPKKTTFSTNVRFIQT